MRRLRILVLMLKQFVPPESTEGLSEKDIASWKTEFDVMATLRDLGHEVHPLGVEDSLSEMRHAIQTWKPHLAFNLLEEFSGVHTYGPYVVSFLELMKQRYTGCNPRGLMLSCDKALSKKILTYHRINVPRFAVFTKGRAVKLPKRLPFPLLVKSTTEQGSVGISQASVVHSEEKLSERVVFVHEQLQTDAIAEQYIVGRELYVGVVGNQRLLTLPIWEMKFENLPDGAPRIATEKVKWDSAYQRRAGVTTAAADLSKEVTERVIRTCKRLYRILNLSGYARIDLRLTESGEIYVLEANPNPQIANGEDFAESAKAGGIKYPDLLERILALGLKYPAPWQE